MSMHAGACSCWLQLVYKAGAICRIAAMCLLWQCELLAQRAESGAEAVSSKGTHEGHTAPRSTARSS